MSQIIIGKADGKNIGFDLDALLVTRLLIQANSGGGKSYLLRKLLEAAFGKVQCFVIDVAGEFASLREKYGYVLVGEGGETPADIRSAGLVAEKLLQVRASAVFDLYSVPPADRHEWVKRFLTAMMNAPKKLWHPVVVVVDEAHKFCPEKGEGESAAKEMMLSLASDGRKYGYCAAFATQRLAKLDKSGAAELLNVMIGPTFIDVDLARAHKALGILPKEQAAFNQQMRTMKPGSFWALGRAISKVRVLVQVGHVVTTHPKPGAAHVAEPPPPPAKVKALLPKLADLPQEAEEKARTEAEFRREIRELRQKVAQAERSRPATPPAVKSDPLQARVIRDQAIGMKQLRAALEEAMKITAKINAIGFDGVDIKPEEVAAAVEKAAAEVGRIAAHKMNAKRRELEALQADVNRLIVKLNARLGDEKLTIDLSVVKNEPVTVRSAAPLPVARRNIEIVPLDGLTAVQQNILNQLGELDALGIKTPERSQVSLLAGYTNSRSGGFSEPMGDLVRAGLVSVPAPGRVALTADGHSKAQTLGVPLSIPELHSRLCEKLGGAEAKILREIIAIYPESITKEDLGARLNYTNVRSGGFSEPIGRLRTLGIVDSPQKGMVRAADWLFLEGAA